MVVLLILIKQIRSSNFVCFFGVWSGIPHPSLLTLSTLPGPWHPCETEIYDILLLGTMHNDQIPDSKGTRPHKGALTYSLTTQNI